MFITLTSLGLKPIAWAIDEVKRVELKGVASFWKRRNRELIQEEYGGGKGEGRYQCDDNTQFDVCTSSSCN